MIIDAKDKFVQHRDADICQTYNRMFSPYQHHRKGDRVGLFAGHSDPNKELDRLWRKSANRIISKTPTPEG